MKKLAFAQKGGKLSSTGISGQDKAGIRKFLH
ncbi:hypothetical protein T11_17318 [Trichinella zimbabwensis]|uniref:Uncharacterized protein n=1 Tax=Trichinella zimbabwensis TaxID=268475 RepID=A0A0V1GEA2_9BILA|nr:hypothetical protein T11_17318 [Trichinella zimbabwensis]